ncbi:MAG: hypothetical protein EOO85_03640 [Pedobacter sp.]|nr:MAG: hypothetical protein EOO85_03640 [Pedobacter sp.]
MRLVFPGHHDRVDVLVHEVINHNNSVGLNSTGGQRQMEKRRKHLGDGRIGKNERVYTQCLWSGD